MSPMFIKSSLHKALIESIAFVLMIIVGFIFVEPIVSHSAAASDVFTVRQQITSEISFLVAAPDVVMAGAIGGITGGAATGTTDAVVQTNSASGYVMDIKFENSPAMLGEATASTAIVDYDVASAGVPDYSLIASTSATFAYTVSAATASDIDPSFLDGGVSCGAGSYTANKCWMGPSTTDFRIINRSTSAGSGASTTITFVVNVPNNPSPVVESDYYTATTTLTATTQ